MLPNTTIAVWVVNTTSEGGTFLVESVVLCPGLSIIETNIINAIALPTTRIPQPLEILLSMARDLHWCPSLDKVLRDALPVTTTIHMQAAKE
jgi:hypothetical protein